MVTEESVDPFADSVVPGSGRMTPHNSQVVHEGGADQGAAPALDPALFSMLLGRVEQLSRELGRAEAQRTLIEQHIARLEQQIERLSRQQESVN